MALEKPLLIDDIPDRDVLDAALALFTAAETSIRGTTGMNSVAEVY